MIRKVKSEPVKDEAKIQIDPNDIKSLPKRDQKALAAILNDPVTWGELFTRNRNGRPAVQGVAGRSSR